VAWPRRNEVDADADDTESSGHFFQGAAIAATDVEDALNGEGISTQCLNDVAGVAQQTVNRGYLAVDARC
jgi:hypothetical protein